MLLKRYPSADFEVIQIEALQGEEHSLSGPIVGRLSAQRIESGDETLKAQMTLVEMVIQGCNPLPFHVHGIRLSRQRF